MTRGRINAAMAIVGSLTLTFCAGAARAQQQFGPSPQAMYKQHPGSAPTYVSYGVGSITPTIAASNARQVAAATPAKPAAKSVAKPAHARPSTSAVVSRRKAAGQAAKGTAGM